MPNRSRVSTPKWEPHPVVKACFPRVLRVEVLPRTSLRAVRGSKKATFGHPVCNSPPPCFDVGVVRSAVWVWASLDCPEDSFE